MLKTWFFFFFGDVFVGEVAVGVEESLGEVLAGFGSGGGGWGGQVEGEPKRRGYVGFAVGEGVVMGGRGE